MLENVTTYRELIVFPCMTHLISLGFLLVAQDSYIGINLVDNGHNLEYKLFLILIYLYNLRNAGTIASHIKINECYADFTYDNQQS